MPEGLDAAAPAIAVRERALYDAMIAEDYAALDALLADDCTYVHSTGVEETKAQYLQAMRDGLYEYERIEARNLSVRGADRMASVAGTVLMIVGRRGEPKQRVLLLSTLVWVLEDGQWRLLRRHATRTADSDALFSLSETREARQSDAH